jgi:hypothetical protein
MGSGMMDGLGKALLVMAFGIAAVGGGIGWGVSHFSDKNDGATVGVRMTKEQMILRKNGALCDGYLTQAFDQSLKAEKVVDLKLPQNPAQHCPDTPKN